MVAGARRGIPPECRASECSKDNCSASLEGIADEFLLVDMDCNELGIQRRTRCDYVFVGEVNYVVVIELKSGTMEVNHLIDQMSGGALLADQLVVPTGARVRFRAVLVHARELPVRHVKRLRKRQIRFRDRSAQIETLRAGGNLKDVLR